MKLDIGCGARKREGFIGVDPAPYFNADLKCTLAEVHYYYPNGTVDEVYTRRVLQHIPDDLKALQQIYLLLKPGGYATVIVSSWRGWLFYQLWWRHRNKVVYPCFHLYTKGRLKDLVRRLRESLPWEHVSYVTFATTEGCRQHNYDLKMVLSKPILSQGSGLNGRAESRNFLYKSSRWLVHHTWNLAIWYLFKIERGKIKSWFYSKSQIWLWVHYLYCNSLGHFHLFCNYKRKCGCLAHFKRSGFRIKVSSEVSSVCTTCGQREICPTSKMLK